MARGARVVVLGKQGAGKGTQAVRLSRHYVVPHISTGDTFRAAVRSGSEFGRLAKDYLDAGDLVPDEIVIGVVRERLERRDASQRGFILDGFPRTVRQAEALVDIMIPAELDLVVNLDIDTDTILIRLAGRRVCADCGANYSVVENPPRVRGLCDVCGGEVIQRDDDTEEAIRRRLEHYERETAPLVHWYKQRGLLATLPAIGTPDEVTDRIVDRVEGRRARQEVTASPGVESQPVPD
ncbi:MAG: adenylate kinase [Acidimicrobiaceae bacterium]|nr:adenylate kinase [Acidimicrobiaceae bacterium]